MVVGIGLNPVAPGDGAKETPILLASRVIVARRLGQGRHFRQQAKRSGHRCRRPGTTQIHCLDTFSKEKKIVDEEMAKLRKLDPKLADELEEYRKNYKGGIAGSPVKVDE